MAKSKPWEKQEGESSKAFEAFAMYRDLGLKRTQAEVGRQLGKSENLMNRWSMRYDWVKRAEAWDAEQDRILAKAQLDDIKKMRKRHADVASAMIIKAAKALQRIPEDEIKAGDISRMVDVASKLERISRGDVGEVVEERQGEAVANPVTFYMPDNHRDEKE